MGSQDRVLHEAKAQMSRSEVADLLESLARGRRRGPLTVSDGGPALDPPDALHCDIEVKESPKPDGLKLELELELWWMTGDTVPDA